VAAVAGYCGVFIRTDGRPVHDCTHVFKMFRLFFECCLGKLKVVLKHLLGRGEGS